MDSPSLSLPVRTAASQCGAKLERFPAVFREYCLVTIPLRFRIEHGPFPVGSAVIPKLQGVTADEDFSRSHKTAQSLLIVPKQMLVHGIMRVAGHDQQNRNRMCIAAGRFQVVGQILEDQTLIERPEGSRQLGKIIGGADDQSVGFPDGVEDWRQAVSADAVSLELFLFAAFCRAEGPTSGSAPKIRPSLRHLPSGT